MKQLLRTALFLCPLVLAAQSPQAGKKVFAQCAGCHNPTSTEARMGPGLKGLYKKPMLGNGLKPSDLTVMKYVNEGAHGMPAYGNALSPQQKKDLVAYLRTL